MKDFWHVRKSGRNHYKKRFTFVNLRNGVHFGFAKEGVQNSILSFCRGEAWFSVE